MKLVEGWQGVITPFFPHLQCLSSNRMNLNHTQIPFCVSVYRWSQEHGPGRYVRLLEQDRLLGGMQLRLADI